jgi:hypothetical protein
MERENELYAFSFDECLPAEKTPQGLKACDERGEILYSIWGGKEKEGGRKKGKGRGETGVAGGRKRNVMREGWSRMRKMEGRDTEGGTQSQVQ